MISTSPFLIKILPILLNITKNSFNCRVFCLISRNKRFKREIFGLDENLMWMNFSERIMDFRSFLSFEKRDKEDSWCWGQGQGKYTTWRADFTRVGQWIFCWVGTRTGHMEGFLSPTCNDSSAGLLSILHHRAGGVILPPSQPSAEGTHHSLEYLRLIQS